MAKALYAGKDLPVHRASAGGVEFLVPRVNIHEVLCLELGVTGAEPVEHRVEYQS